MSSAKLIICLVVMANDSCVHCMFDRTGISEPQCNRSVQHLLAPWSGGLNQAFAVKTPPAPRFVGQKSVKPFEMCTIKLRRRVLAAVYVDGPSARVITQGGMIHFVIHEHHITWLVCDRIPSGNVFRSEAKVVDGTSQRFPEGRVMTPGNHTQATVRGSQKIQV